MSAYGDYKAEEERMEAMNKPMTCEYCSHRKDVCINMASRYYGEDVDLEDSCEDWE